ncbi:MAG: hypothetical protein AAFV29_17410, partial [Myxococcota bacterium]
MAFGVHAGCSDDDNPTPRINPDSGVSMDTGVTMDSGVEVDAGSMADAGMTADAGAAFPERSCADFSGTCVSFEPGQEAALQEAVNALGDNTTVVLGEGTFSFDNAVTFRRADSVTFVGQGIDVTTLDFSAQATQSNGVDVIGDDFTIEHMTIVDAKKDALRIEDSTDVRIRFVKTTWSAGPVTTNGAYGIYPVRCR